MNSSLPERAKTVARIVILLACLGAAAAAGPVSGDGPTRLDAVWRLVDEHFYDPEFNGVGWPAMRDVYLAQAARAGSDAELAAVINGMLDELGTSHTRYFTPDTPEYFQLLDVFHAPLREEIARRYGDGPVSYEGIGLVTREIEGKRFITGLIDGTPASRARLTVGDEILAADGAPFHPIDSFAGKLGTPIRLALQRGPAASSRLEVEVVPTLLQPGDMFVKAIRTSARVVRHEGVDVAYVRIWSYAGEHYQDELEQQLRDEPLRDAAALVLDVRDGWGGASPEYLNLFNHDVPVMRSRPRGAEWREWDTQWRKPVVLLVNEGTRSGKELLAHGFRRYAIGPVVGARTGGAVVAGRSFLLGDGGLLYVAVSDVDVDGKRLEGLGVEPDVDVPFDVRYAAGADPQLERALAVAAAEVLERR